MRLLPLGILPSACSWFLCSSLPPSADLLPSPHRMFSGSAQGKPLLRAEQRRPTSAPRAPGTRRGFAPTRDPPAERLPPSPPQIPADKCDLLEDLVQKLQKREVRLNRQEFLHKVRDIAGDDAPQLRQALKQLAVDKSPTSGAAETPQLAANGFHLPSTDLSSSDLLGDGASETDAKPAVLEGNGSDAAAAEIGRAHV